MPGPASVTRGSRLEAKEAANQLESHVSFDALVLTAGQAVGTGRGAIVDGKEGDVDGADVAGEVRVAT